MSGPSAAAEAPARRDVVWGAGLIVALGAATATAHGLYEVALAAQVPRTLAWLYPLITDGLALVAYAATARLRVRGRRYAWTVVVLAAGLSGLAQATYLAGGIDSSPAPPVLRFGVGAWPAVAAATVAHLLYLLGSHQPSAVHLERRSDALAVPAVPFNTVVQPAVQPEAEQSPPPFTAAPDGRPSEQPAVHPPTGLNRDAATRGPSPASERARSVARRHASLHGHLPTVSELTAMAQVARGTAQAVLKDLRQQPTQLQVVPDTDNPRTKS